MASLLTERLGEDVRREKLWTEQWAAYPLLGDVERTMELLETLVVWATRTGSSFPCIQYANEEGVVPIIGVPNDPWLGRYPYPLYQLALSAFNRLVRSIRGHSYVPYPPPFPFQLLAFPERVFEPLSVLGSVVWSHPLQIGRIVFSPLAKFLAVRFSWLAENPEFRSLGAEAFGQANNPYLPFTVHTQTSGLRIHYSKTFALNFNSVLGAPTTPVKGWILPGIHKFAGMDSRGRMRYDKGTFTTPPDFSASLII